MSLLFGIIFLATAIGLKVSADALALCLFLWLIAMAIETHN